MVKLVSKIISKIKHREYKIDENITDKDLFSIVATRFFMLIRGFFVTIGFKKRSTINFIGRKVKIKSKNHIECASGLTINDNCTINALCKGGVKIGNNFSLGQNSIIECTGVIRELGESLVIGNDVGISPNAFISVRGNVKTFKRRFWPLFLLSICFFVCFYLPCILCFCRNAGFIFYRRSGWGRHSCF